MHLRTAPCINIKHLLHRDCRTSCEGALSDADRSAVSPENNGGISAGVTYFLQKSKNMFAVETYWLAKRRRM